MFTADIGKSAWPAFVGHCLFGIVGSMVVGFLPAALTGQLLYGTWFEPLMPGFTLTALFLGYLINRKFSTSNAARWVWVPWLFWLLLGVQELVRYWSPTWDYHPNAWRYAFDNLFGPTPLCSGTECLYELSFTAPFLCSVAYSLGATLALKREPSYK